MSKFVSTDARPHQVDDDLDRDPRGVVIFSPVNGVFLAMAIGLGFWSKLDPLDLDVALAFESESEAREFMGGGNWPSDVTLVTVDIDADGYASMESCTRAGIPPWLTSESESANMAPI